MEGGFGKAPAQFIASAPNIRELFVALDLWSNDNPSGLCNHTIKNAKASRLWECLSTCIPKWLNLVILEYHTTFGMTSLRKDKYMELATILKASPSVKHMVLDCVPRYELCELAGVPSLDNISVESIQPPYEGSYPLPRKIVQVRTKYPDNPAPEVLPIPSVVGRFNPLMNVPKPTAEFIWDLIFSFATHSYYVEKPPSVKPFTALNLSPRRAPFNRTARRLSLVSKSFREIVRRHMYSTVQVESDENFATFCNVIKYNDTLALLVRVLRVNCLRHSLGEGYDNLMSRLLPKLTSLVYLDAPLIDLRQFKLLNPAVVPNLQTIDVRLSLRGQSGRETVELGALSELAYFRCRLETSSRHAQRLHTLILDLPNLTTFSMGVQESEDTLDAFCTVRMPSLTHLQLCGRHPKTEEFLRLNGETLKVLEIFNTPSSALWTWCPHLEHLRVYDDPASVFKSLPGGQGHSFLSKLYPNLPVLNSNIEKAMLLATDGFEFVDFSQFPNFRGVHIRGLRGRTRNVTLRKTQHATVLECV